MMRALITKTRFVLSILFKAVRIKGKAGMRIINKNFGDIIILWAALSAGFSGSAFRQSSARYLKGF
jgi:hypothetical protein